MIFASADQVATALVTAAALFGEDPAAIARGSGGRARLVAFAGLIEALPDINRRAAARGCGFAVSAAGQANLATARKAKWWDEVRVDEVVGALVADEVEPEEGAFARGRIAPSAAVDLPHFEADERRLIARMHAGGADAAAIAAALGASAGEVGAWLDHNGGA